MNKKQTGYRWSELRKELLSPDERSANTARIGLMAELTKVRNERGVSQRELEELSGVKQPIIARMESGRTNPQLDTVLKVLAPLGKTLAVVPLENK